MSEARELQRRAFQSFADGHLEEAVTLYRQAVATDPKLAIAWNGLSRVLLQKGDLPGATEAAQRLVELEPDEALNHSNLSILYQSQGMIPEAEEEKAIAMKLELAQSSRS